MKLETLAAEPQLQKITIEDDVIMETYGEAIEFWVYDRQDMKTFFQLASIEGDDSLEKMADIIKDIIYTEDGKPVLNESTVLPTPVMIKVVEGVVNNLGNSITQTLTK
jgi:hypothetical protein